MGRKHNDAFKREAVRIALTSGLRRRQVASNLAKENERLRRENRLLLEERELLKKATVFFVGVKQMRFALVKEYQTQMPHRQIMPYAGCDIARIPSMALPPDQPKAT